MALTVPFCFYPLNVEYSGGIALLSALCRAKGLNTELCMLGSEDGFRRCLAEWRDPVICFSAVCHADYERAAPFMALAQAAGKTVLLGGTWANLGREALASVDHVCRGDGETLPDFLLNGDDRLFRERMVWTDLNALPLPDYELFKGIPFQRGLPETDGLDCLPYLSSRGCPYPCTFCQIRKQPKGYRIRTKVEEDLKYLAKRYGPDLFFIGDAQLPYNSATWRDSWGNFRHPFVAYIRADIEPELLLWLIDRGMRGCGFGVESGDENYRNAVLKKGLTDEQLWRTVEILDKHSVWYVPFLMTGLPGESFAQKTQTARMARKLGKYVVTWNYEEL